MYDLKQYLEWLKDFTQAFCQGNSEDEANIAIKRDHSLRVLDNAAQISGSLDLAHPLAELSLLAALFHDVGRFPQYAKFRTFNDRVSANHAALSVDVLRERGTLSELMPEDRRLVMGAIFLHNRRYVPATLSPRLKTITDIVRDADKLDIFPVLISHFSPDSPSNGAVTLHLKPHPTEYTRSILSDVQSGKMGKYDEMVWINDLKLLLCSWVYDLNFPISRKIVLQKGFVDAVVGSLPDAPEFVALAKQLRRRLSSTGPTPPQS
jgi:hypothetical protein